MADPLTEHYRTLRTDRGFEPINRSIGELPESFLGRTFVCGKSVEAFASGVESGARSLVTIGVTPTGPPHLGTLGQLRLAIRFQRAGFDVQVVIADLAAYNGAGQDYEVVRERARRYERFVCDLGFDANAGRLRIQGEDTDALQTAQLLARYYDPDADDEPEHEPTEFERRLQKSYEMADTPGSETTRFAGELVGLLLAVDSLHPVIEDGYENVALVLGADNAGMAEHVERVLAASPYDATVAGLYSRLVPGLDGHPKLSKSIPDSRFTLADSPATIRRRILDPDNDADDPHESMVYQSMLLASELPQAERAILGGVRRDDQAWEAAKRRFADSLVEIARIWKV